MTVICRQCFQAFPNEQELNLHVAETPGHRHHCGICSRQYDTPGALQAHMTASHPPDGRRLLPPQTSNTGRIMCRWCNRLYNDQYSLEQHVTASHPSGTRSAARPQNGILGDSRADLSASGRLAGSAENCICMTNMLELLEQLKIQILERGCLSCARGHDGSGNQSLSGSSVRTKTEGDGFSEMPR